MRQNPNAPYDTTRYANFDPKMVANMSGDDLRDEGRISDEWRDELVDHFRFSDARSVAEMMEEVPAWFDHTDHLAGVAEMHADDLEVRVTPEGEFVWNGDGFDLEGIVQRVLEENGQGDATVHGRDSGTVAVQLHNADALRDVVGDLTDRYLNVEVDQAFECPPSVNVSMCSSVARAAERGDWNLEEGWDAYDFGPGTDTDDDSDEDADDDSGMVISIEHRDGSGVDENVRTYEQVAGGLVVEYTDESKAVYADGEVVKAWSSPDAVGEGGDA